MSATPHTYLITFTATSITEAVLKTILDTIVNNNWTIENVQRTD